MLPNCRPIDSKLFFKDKTSCQNYSFPQQRQPRTTTIFYANDTKKENIDPTSEPREKTSGRLVFASERPKWSPLLRRRGHQKVNRTCVPLPTNNLKQLGLHTSENKQTSARCPRWSRKSIDPSILDTPFDFTEPLCEPVNHHNHQDGVQLQPEAVEVGSPEDIIAQYEAPALAKDLSVASDFSWVPLDADVEDDGPKFGRAAGIAWVPLK